MLAGDALVDFDRQASRVTPHSFVGHDDALPAQSDADPAIAIPDT